MTTGKTLPFFRIVDLTHPITPESPLWPGDPPVTRHPAATIAGDGYHLNRWALGEHAGTHVGAPSHFSPNGDTIDRIAPEQLFAPLAVIDFLPNVADHYQAELGAETLLKNEEENGPIPPRALVVMHSGWSERWPEQERVFEHDRNGGLIHPGFAEESVRWLIRERDICGIGTDTPGVDPGQAPAFNSGKLLAEQGLIHIENMAKLDKVPARGALVVIGALPLQGGSGSPARILALVPAGS